MSDNGGTRRGLNRSASGRTEAHSSPRGVDGLAVRHKVSGTVQETRVGERLREIRLEKGWTIEQVEAATGISGPYLSKVERGRALPAAETFARIAASLDPPQSLFRELEGAFLYERDRSELQKLGFSTPAAALSAAMNRLDPAQLAQAVDVACRHVPAIRQYLDATQF
jgi:transcriptional regulator with XRE-family HTH domain